MHPRGLAAAFLLLLPAGSAADVLVLLDGRKVSGSVSKTAEEYVVRTDGKTLRLRNSLVDRWYKTPKEYLGEKESLPNEAKDDFLLALRATDPATEEERLKSAREKNARAREAFAETRRLFPEGYPDLDRTLLQLVRLERALKAWSGGARPEAAPAVGEAPDALSQAAYDLGAWRASGLLDVALRRFRADYGPKRDFGVAYGAAYLSTLDALSRKRDYARCVDDWETVLKGICTARQREHAEAILAGLKAAVPCAACLGTAKAKCGTCSGDGRYDVQCNTCGGAGWIQRGAVMRCRPCGGAGRYRDVKCAKCEGTATVPCRARACRPRPEPLALSEIADSAPCAPCGGEGVRGAARCEACVGLGVRLLPKSAPQKTLEGKE